MSFLFDESLSAHAVRSLREEGYQGIDHVFEHLPRSAGDLDEQCKRLAVEDAHVVVTRKVKHWLARDHGELYESEGVSALVLAGKLPQYSLAELEQWLIAHWPRIDQRFRDATDTIVVFAYPNGQLKVSDG